MKSVDEEKRKLTKAEAIGKAQKIVSRRLDKDLDRVAELIAERREEARRDEDP